MTSQPTILSVDDDPDDLDLISVVLQDINPSFTVLQAAHGRHAIELLQSKTNQTFPHLIILDMNMPVMDGRQTIKALKDDEVTAAIPVVIFTTSDSPIDKNFCKLYGVEMVTKPTTYDKLREAVTKLLAHANLPE